MSSLLPLEALGEGKTSRAVFPPTYKLISYCFVIGLLGAAAALAFDAAVNFAQSLMLEKLGGFVPPSPGVVYSTPYFHSWVTHWWVPVSTTLGGLLSGFLVYSLAPEAEGHGTDAAVETYHQKGAEVRPRIPFIKGVASALTIGSGGVAGREGPTAQIAVGLGAIASSLLRLRGQERRILLLASMSAGLAAVFRAPLGMAIFSVEILYSGMVFESEALIYTVISAVTAYAIHGFFVGWSPIFVIPAGLTFHSPAALLGFGILGVLAGVVGAILPRIFYGIRDQFRRIKVPRHFKPAIGGLVVGLVGVAIPEVLSTGYGWVQLAIAGKISIALLAVILLLKAPAMGLTIGSGGSGGVFAPTVTMGALLGGIVGLSLAALFPEMGVVPAAFVVVGMASVFSGAARTPISTLIMVAEMTGGYGLIVPAMLANISAFIVQRSLTHKSRYPTLYEAQVPTREDSPAHRGVFVRRALEMLEGGNVDMTELTLPRLVSLLQFGHPVRVTQDAGILVAVRIASGAALDGQTVVEAFSSLPKTIAVAVIHGQEMIVPGGATRLSAGDQIIAMATSETYQALREQAGEAVASTRIRED
ncbi:MAG: chloride channel protein [Acidobacteriota bacterium]